MNEKSNVFFRFFPVGKVGEGSRIESSNGKLVRGDTRTEKTPASEINTSPVQCTPAVSSLQLDWLFANEKRVANGKSEPEVKTIYMSKEEAVLLIKL